MPFKDKFIKREYSRGYMRNYRAKQKGLTVKPVKPTLLNPVNPKIVKPAVKPCSTCSDLKKQLENLEQQIQNLASENKQILVAKETIQKQLSELENKPVKKASESKLKAPKKVAVRKSLDQSLRVDLDKLEKETGLKKDWKNPA